MYTRVTIKAYLDESQQSKLKELTRQLNDATRNLARSDMSESDYLSAMIGTWIEGQYHEMISKEEYSPLLRYISAMCMADGLEQAQPASQQAQHLDSLSQPQQVEVLEGTK